MSNDKYQMSNIKYQIAICHLIFSPLVYHTIVETLWRRIAEVVELRSRLKVEPMWTISEDMTGVRYQGLEA